MRYSVFLTAQAESDLWRIQDYITNVLHSRMNAKRLIQKLEAAVMSLDMMPERFHILNREPWQSRGLRLMTVDRYCVFYIAEPKTQTATVLRVMYGGRDMDKQLQMIDW